VNLNKFKFDVQPIKKLKIMRKQLSFLALTMLISALAFAQAEKPDYSSESPKAPSQIIPLNVNYTPQKQDEGPSSLFRMNGEIPLDGLVGYYTLDNGTYVDSSPSSFDLEPAGNGGALFAVDNRFGEPDKALNFINEYLSLASNPTAFDFDLDSNFSLCVWINIGQPIVEWTGLLNNWNGPGTGGYYLGINPTQGVRWNVNGPIVIDSPAIPTGEWTHVAVTYNAFDSNLYINGVLVGTAANNTLMFSSPLPFTVGTQANLTTLQFPGVIDEVLVYDRVLSGSEIEDIFTVLSIEDIDAFSSQVKVFPNPSSSTLSITYDSSLGTIKSFRITDNQGRLIVNNSFEGSETTIDLNAIASGIYILELQTIDGISITKKIIKN
jgi:hypothetical protein